MIEYRSIFLNEIKSLLPYFVELSDNDLILSKIYFNNCIIEKLDQKPIIIIIYNKNTFFTNNNH